jgi:integrase
MKAKLTKTAVEAIAPPENGERLVWDTELTGFGLRVTANGKRSYIAQQRVNGKTRRVTIAKHGVYTAEEARKRARTKLGNMTEGEDPAEVKARQKVLATTLADAVEGYLRDRDLKERTIADVRRQLNGAFAQWKDRPLVELTREKVARRFRELSESAPSQANQQFRILRSILNYARAAYRLPGDEPIFAENPVNVLSETRAWNRQRTRNNYVPLDRIGEWWGAVQAERADPALTSAGRTGADLVAFLTLTGLRKGEAAALRWANVDLADKSLRLEDTKNGEPVTLPLSEAAVRVLAGRPDGVYLFAGSGGDGTRPDMRPALARLEARTGIRVTPHDLRRTFRAIGGALDVELWKCKALMNHKQRQDVTLGSYTDLEDVRYLRPEADAIAQYLDHQATAAEAENVLPLNHGAA